MSNARRRRGYANKQAKVLKRPKPLTTQQVVQNASEVLDRYAARHEEMRKVVQRAWQLLKRAEKNCTCGAVDRVLKEYPNAEAEAPYPSGDERAAELRSASEAAPASG